MRGKAMSRTCSAIFQPAEGQNGRLAQPASVQTNILTGNQLFRSLAHGTFLVQGKDGVGEDVGDAAHVVNAEPGTAAPANFQIAEDIAGAGRVVLIIGLGDEDALGPVSTNRKVVEIVEIAVPHEDTLAAVVLEAGVGNDIPVETQVDADPSGLIVVEVEPGEEALLSLIGREPVEMVIAGGKVAHMDAAAVFFQDQAPAARCAGGDAFHADVLGAADG